ncbi:hypothetical protein [Streptomyces sp. NPDC005548]|uniref:hypothetical protein n=1 Tax=Streptomyces sp. NPDC005548 TaxID=3364724 RepID=UPI0036C8BA62
MISKGFGTSAGFFAYAAITLALGAGIAAGATAAGPVSDEGPNAVFGISLAGHTAPNPSLLLTPASDEGPNVVTAGADGDEGPNVVAARADGDEGPNVIAA